MPPQKVTNHPELKPYSIKYKVIHDGDKVGTASRQLELLTNGQWQLAMRSKVKYYFFSDKRQETSRFALDKGLIMPIQYQRLTDTTMKSDTNLIQNFDWNKGIEQGTYKDKKWSHPIKAGIADQLTELEVVRQYLKAQKAIPAIDISYRGSIRHHEFQVVGEEVLKTAKGDIKTAKLLLDEKSRKRQTYFWLSLDGEFLPLQIQRIKKGEEEAKLVATEW